MADYSANPAVTEALPYSFNASLDNPPTYTMIGDSGDSGTSSRFLRVGGEWVPIG
jgi:hypothetical protein